MAFQGPDYRQIGLPGYGKVAQIPNSSNRGKMEESWGRIEFSTTASLSFTSLGANFPRNLAAENSITPPFHLAELLLRQIFTGVNLIGG